MERSLKEIVPERSPALAPPPGNPRFPHCDGIRGLSALAVVACHAGASIYLANGGYLGRFTEQLGVAVYVFFVLSGFLLYRPFAAALAADRPRPSLRDFARRRVLRVVPAYWVALVILALWPGLPGVYSPHGWVFFLFGQVYSGGTWAQGLTPAWTLCVEVGFYAFLPVFVLALGWLTAGRSRAVARRLELFSLLAFALVGFVWQIAWSAGLMRAHLGVQTVPGNTEFFAAGMLLAVLSVSVERGEWQRTAMVVERWPGGCWLAAAFLYWLLAAAFYARPLPYARLLQVDLARPALASSLGREALLFLIAALVVAPAALGTAGRGLVRRVLLWRPIAFLGVVSYGIYLWHQPLLLWIAPRIGANRGPYLFDSIALTLTLLTLAMAVPLAIASYYLVELPFLSRKERPFVRRTRRAHRWAGADERPT